MSGVFISNVIRCKEDLRWKGRYLVNALVIKLHGITRAEIISSRPRYLLVAHIPPRNGSTAEGESNIISRKRSTEKHLLLCTLMFMIRLWAGPWFNTKMSPYQYMKSHCEDKTIVRSSHLHNGISYAGKMASLYWKTPPWCRLHEKFKCSSNPLMSRFRWIFRWLRLRLQ